MLGARLALRRLPSVGPMSARVEKERIANELAAVARLASEADRFVARIEASAMLDVDLLGGMGSAIVDTLERMDDAGK